MLKVAIKTLGCRANRYESDRLLDELGASAAVVSDNELADVIVVNTCTVTHVADRKSRQIVTQLKKSYPKAKLVVFGCGSRTSRDQYEEMDFIDYIAHDRGDLREYILKLRPSTLTHDGLYFSAANVDQDRTRSLIKIQDGCDRFCTYCIIPFSRGMPRSFPSDQIIDEINEKHGKGYKEVVITGINIGDWTEGDKDFGDLLEMILDKTSVERVRISSIEPCDFSDKFYEIMKHPRICNHLHLCLQSGSDNVLKAMGRKYDTTAFREICGRLREAVSDIAITTDMITGFPGESEEDFKAGYDFAKEIGFAKIHVFPYSKRRHTKAAERDDHVPYVQKKGWAKKLLELSKELEEEFKSQFIDDKMDVLVEEIDKKGRWQGYTSNFVRVAVKSDRDLGNKIVTVKMDGLYDHRMIKGELV